jgi:hypothetical protein
MLTACSCDPSWHVGFRLKAPVRWAECCPDWTPGSAPSCDIERQSLSRLVKGMTSLEERLSAAAIYLCPDVPR